MNEEELKTLKDLEQKIDSPIERTFANIKELKAEAVKWWKWFDKTIEDEKYPQIFIEHFFNLTEEDLNKGENEE